MKKINNKGFTLFELLVVISILVLLILVILPNILSIINNDKKEKYVADAKNLISLAKYKYKLYKYNDLFTVKNNGCKETTASALEFDVEVDPDENNYDLSSSKVMICYINNKYEYYVKMYSKDSDGDITKYITGGEIYSYVKESDLNINFINDGDMGYIKDNLVLWYDAKNNTGKGYSSTANTWKDLSENNNDGTLVNNPTWTSSSLSFDGVNDQVTKAYSSSLAPNNFTIKLLLSKTSIVNDEQSIVFTKWKGYKIELNDDNTISFSVTNSDSIDANTIMDLNKMYDIAVSFNGTTQKIYVNGDLKDQRDISGSFAHDLLDLTIGSGSSSNYFNGKIYNIMFYNKMLSDTEINQNYIMDKLRYGL